MDKNILTNRFCGVFVCAIMLFVAQAFAAAWDGKSMSRPQQDKNGVFIITSAEELAWFSDTTNYKLTGDGTTQMYKVNARLDADLDLGNELFVPICGGGGEKKYMGTFDGNGHTISNLRINGAEIAKKKNNARYAQNVGFVAAMSGGTVKNLVLENVDLQSSTDIGLVGSGSQISVGAVVAWQENGTIDGCFASGSIQTSGKGQGVGGIVGNLHKGTVKNCLSTVSIQVSGNEAQVGGIVGLVKKANTITIQSCVYAGSTLTNTGNGSVGAIVGRQMEDKTVLKVEDCFYNSEIGASGVGSAKNSANVTDKSVGTSNVNLEENICTLNGGEIVNGECSKDSPWSVGENSVSLNGSDGYKVIFNAKSGSFGTNAKTKKVLANGAKITTSEISIPSHADSAFAGWSLDENATEPDKDLGVVTKPTTVYAVWYPIYTVTFNAAPGTFADGKTVVQTTKVAKNQKISVDGFEVPFSYTNTDGTKFYFTGWALTEENSEEDTLHVLPIATMDTTLYAVWTEAITYTVTYNDNGHGKTKVDFVRVEQKQKTDAPADPEADPGYKFVAWYTEAACENKFDFDETEIEENWILYAKWDAEKFAINYVLNDGVNNKDNPATYTIEDQTIVLQAPVRDGYDFAGWFYDKDFSEKATQITQGSTGAKTLYAKWEASFYTVSYLAGTNAFGTVSSDKKKHGASIKLKGEGIFTRKDYVQDGWSLTDGGDKVYCLNGSYSGNADLTLYPHWEKAKNLVVTHYGAVTVFKYPKKTIAEMDGEYTDADAVTIENDIPVDQVVLNRDFKIGMMSTITLPFSIDTAKVKGGLFYKFNRVASENGVDKVKIARVKTEQLGANTPYLVMPTETNLTFKSGVTLNTTADPSEELTKGDWRFVGTYEYIEFNDHPDLGRIWGFAAQAQKGVKVGQFVKAGKDVKIKSLRAYLLDLRTNALAKSVGESLHSANWNTSNEIVVEIVDENDNVIQTGKLNTVTGEIHMDSWFDLNGRKLNAKPTTRGTYYHNGKREFIK